jgi:hypothetical protein
MSSNLLLLYPKGRLCAIALDGNNETLSEEEGRYLTILSPFKSITAGTSGILLGTDSENRVFFTSGWQDDLVPLWFQLRLGQVTDSAAEDRLALTASTDSIWSSSSSSEILHCQHRTVTGYRWVRLQPRNLEPLMRICSLVARGLEAESGHLYLTCLGGAGGGGLRLLFLRTEEGVLQEVSLPPGETLSRPLLCPGSVLLLAASGTVYRQSSFLPAIFTNHWKRVRASGEPELACIEVGLSQAWALDAHGDVFFCPDASKLLDWTKVNSTSCGFVELACSADGRIVWGLDRSGCLYARIAIYKELQMGTSWNYVEFVTSARPLKIFASK